MIESAARWTHIFIDEPLVTTCSKMNNTTGHTVNRVNPEAWVEKYRDALFKYALTRLRDVDLAEECIQDTFVAALQSLENFQGLSSEKTWLFSILKHKINDHFRKKYRNSQFNATCSVEQLRCVALDKGGAPVFRPSNRLLDPSRIYEQKEFFQVLKHALSELPSRSALVFILREVVGWGSPEICELMGIKICNLHVIMFRYRRRLRNALKTRWFSEPI